MVYDDGQKKWVPSGSSSGLSKVHIYHHQQNNTFRVVGRKLQDHEVVINCSILKGLKYNQATATFHQWRDSKFVYGLNFSSPQDAEAFARAMMHALEVRSSYSVFSIIEAFEAEFHRFRYRYWADVSYRRVLRHRRRKMVPLGTMKIWAIGQWREKMRPWYSSSKSVALAR